MFYAVYNNGNIVLEVEVKQLKCISIIKVTALMLRSSKMS